MAFPNIRPLDLPNPVAATPIDFRPLSAIGDTIAEGRRKQLMADVLSQATGPDGNLDPAKAGALLSQIGAPEEAGRFLALAQQKAALAQHAGQAGASLAEQSRHNRATEENARLLFAEGKIPPGFQRSDVGMAPIPGGPADPAYINQKAENQQKPRQFNVGDITKLSEEGGKFAQIGGFVDSFKPDYAGYKSQTAGNVATYAGRYLPESVVGETTAKASEWWQGYDRYKNVIRNDLYGSALTPTEQAAFERADVNPGMDPKAIQNNLRIQKDVVQNGLKRKANALISSGYDPAPVSAAYGVDLKELGVTSSGRGVSGETPSRPAQTSQGMTREIANQKMMGVRSTMQQRIQAGGNPQEELRLANDALRRAGLPPLQGP